MSVRKVVTAAEAVALVQDGDVVASSGYGGNGTPEALFQALEQRFLDHKAPRGLTLPPDAWSSQRHWHTEEDEFVYVLRG